MKQIISIVFFTFSVIAFLTAQNQKPYTLVGAIKGATVENVSSEVKSKLKAGGFEILGEYNPTASNSRKMIAVTHPQLLSAVKSVGGLTGFASALRVAITKEGSTVNISYTNPYYWGPAYFTKKYDQVSTQMKTVDEAFKNVFASYGLNKPFGSKKGHSTSKLKKYKYMMGMPYFEDNIKLASYASYKQAVNQIDAKLAKGVQNLEKVYEVSIASHKIKLYGIGLGGPDGEASFMKVIDQASPKHTAFLPYEILVYENTAYMLHGRFRIALSFPDLTMGTFMKIVSTPGNIEDMLKKACK